MSINIILASLLALAVVGYWVICRKRAYEYQKSAALVVEGYFADKQVLDKDKRSLFEVYTLLRKWYVFPVLAFMTPGLLILKFIVEGTTAVKPVKRTKPETFDQAFTLLIKMAIAKNPIISVISLAITGIVFAFLVPICLLFKRMITIPSSTDYAQMIESLTIKVAAKAHIH